MHVPNRELSKKFQSRNQVSKHPTEIPNLSDPSGKEKMVAVDHAACHVGDTDVDKWALGK